MNAYVVGIEKKNPEHQICGTPSFMLDQVLGFEVNAAL